ncbi:hypothetical protein [Pengzhenrongella phosphoraccumulans]|uniref:hypothetical protein n=1 Tax=Pengzhenrongella phosphoraccumulans TaxID=3114394 RepID=UPI00388DC0B7
MQSPTPPPVAPQPRNHRRGWLVTALVAAVALLLGSFVAVAALTGAVGPGSGYSDRMGPGDGTHQFWRGGDRGPGMMGDGDRTERPGPRTDRRDHMRGWENP